MAKKSKATEAENKAALDWLKKAARVGTKKKVAKKAKKTVKKAKKTVKKAAKKKK
jgi:hypothetical protein